MSGSESPQEDTDDSTSFLELRNVQIEVSRPKPAKSNPLKLQTPNPNQSLEIHIKTEPSSDDEVLDLNTISPTETVNNLEIMTSSLDPKYVLRLVPSFSGNSNELHKFISSCEFIHKTLPQQDHGQFLELIRLKLDGKAYHLMKYKTLDTWSNFKKLLENEFSDTRSIGHLQMELSSNRQMKNESVKTYANRVESLLHDLNEACIATVGTNEAETIKKLNANIALKSFQEGLDGSIKLIVKACRFTKISEAINRAVEEEATLNQTFKFPNDRFDIRKKSEFCKICRRSGHSIEKCFKNVAISPNHNNASTSTLNVRSINSVSSIPCAYCKKYGHHIKECFLKKRSDEMKDRSNSLSSSSAIKSGNAVGFSSLERGTPSKVRDLTSASRSNINQQ